MSIEEIEKQAAVWLAREDAGLSDPDSRALDRWLDANVHHRVAYLRLKAAWQRADRLSALKSPVMRTVPSRTMPIRAMLAAVAAVLALAVGGAVWFWPRPAAEQVYATAVGRMQAVRLADGSRMELNTDTRVRADVTQKRRIVTLDAGEAYFDVVHDASRPFTVYAGSRRITDLGTRFSVFRNGDDVRVTVQEGRVKVDTLDRAALDTPVTADAGHMVVTKGSETLVSARPDDDIRSDLAWREGRLVFNQQPLAEAAEQFNRYNARKIVVQGNARRIRIGGSFKADNVDGFVLLLQRGFGLSVDDQGKTVVVSR